MAKGYLQAVQYLNSLLNLEKKPFYSYKESLKLGRVYKLAEYLKIPYNNLKCIHIAGTKGKGSTAHFTAYLLASLGYKIGLFTSPHLFNFRERVKIVEAKEDKYKERLISEKKSAEIIKKFKIKLKSFPGEKPTYFELLTLLGLQYFLEEKIDYAVIEVGLGGRLDSTNIVTPLVSLITHIGYDHTHLLGNTLSEIAFEKSGIVKKEVPVITSSQKKSAEKVIKKIAKKNKSSFLMLEKDFKIKNLKAYKDYTSFDFEFRGKEIKNIKIYQKGIYQAENAALALAAVMIVTKKNNEQGLYKKALSNCFLEGRFEILSKKPLIVVDVAHNKSSAKVVSDNLERYFSDKKVILIFSCATDKKPSQMFSLLKYDQLILTQFDHPRSFNVFELKKVLKKKAIITNNLEEAMKEAKNLYNQQSLILICGSFFLVAEAKKLVSKKKKIAEDNYARI